MNFCYVEENDKKYIFSRVKMEESFCRIPKIEENTKIKKIAKIVKKLKKVLEKEEKNAVVLSEKLKQHKSFLQMLSIKQINYFDGRWLFPYITKEIVEYLIKYMNLKKEETEVAILVNQVTENVVIDIRRMAREFKRVNVVTNHIGKFKKIEQEILKQDGMMITVTNNKRKSLRKSHLIFNMDFVEEIVNQYTIAEQAIIINIEGDIRIKKKRFNGMVVNNYEIQFKNQKSFISDFTQYSLKDIFEAKIYRKDSYENIRNDVEQAGLEIKELIGNNGVIKIS